MDDLGFDLVHHERCDLGYDHWNNRWHGLVHHDGYDLGYDLRHHDRYDRSNHGVDNRRHDQRDELRQYLWNDRRFVDDRWNDLRYHGW
jgi:hypothetical protein